MRTPLFRRHWPAAALAKGRAAHGRTHTCSDFPAAGIPWSSWTMSWRRNPSEMRRQRAEGAATRVRHSFRPPAERPTPSPRSPTPRPSSRAPLTCHRATEDRGTLHGDQGPISHILSLLPTPIPAASPACTSLSLRTQPAGSPCRRRSSPASWTVGRPYRCPWSCASCRRREVRERKRRGNGARST